MSGIQILLHELSLNGTAKTKLAMLAFLHCREFVKNSSVNKADRMFSADWGQKALAPT